MWSHIREQEHIPDEPQAQLADPTLEASVAQFRADTAKLQQQLSDSLEPSAVALVF